MTVGLIELSNYEVIKSRLVIIAALSYRTDHRRGFYAEIGQGVVTPGAFTSHVKY